MRVNKQATKASSSARAATKRVSRRVPSGTAHAVTQPAQYPPHVMEAVEELYMRRTARKSLVKFMELTHPRYQPAWFHKFIADKLQQFLWNKAGADVQGIMIFMPPRHGKSEMVAIRMPAFDFLEHADEHYMGICYGDELATTFSKACRNVIESPQYQRLKRHVLKSRGDTKWELARKDDDQRASYISSGILSAITGEGATRMVIDDPVKNKEEAYSKIIRDKIDANYQTAASTRMAPHGKKFLIMTRWHEDDLAGRLLRRAAEDKKADQFFVIVLAATNDAGQDSYTWNTATGEKTLFAPYTALWPEAYPREELDRTRANLAAAYWNAMYMQAPQPATGGIFKRENWAYYDTIPSMELFIQVYDTAYAQGQENDYSACIDLSTTRLGQFAVNYAWRDKITFAQLVAKVYENWQRAVDTYKRPPDRVLIENKGSGISLGQQIETNNLAGSWTWPDGTTKRVPFVPVQMCPANLSKIVRAQGISGYHESHGILLPRGAEWVADFVDEHALFDKGLHDDCVDCLVHGVTYYVRPLEEKEDLLTHTEAIQISSDLDDYDMENLLQGRTQW